MAFTTPALDHYKDEDRSPLTDGPLDEDQGSWMVSIPLIATVIGNLIAGPMTKAIGRRPSMILACLALLGAWALAFFATSYVVLLTSRIIAGLAWGVANPTAYLLLSELSLVRFRGILGVFNSLMVNFAWLMALVLFSSAKFKTAIPICAIPPAMFLVFGFLVLPESPLWLVERGKEDKAEETLIRLRGEK